MEGLMAGDDAAIRALYARFGRPVYTMGLRLLGTREAAEELTQDVFLTAWRKAARFDPARGRLSTWLMTIAHNLAVDRLRRETGVSRPTLVLVDEVPEPPASTRRTLLIEHDAALRAIASLSEAERRLIARTYFRGMTAREISEADGIPLGTVKTRLRSALIKVRKANEAKERRVNWLGVRDPARARARRRRRRRRRGRPSTWRGARPAARRRATSTGVGDARVRARAGRPAGGAQDARGRARSARAAGVRCRAAPPRRGATL